MNEQIILNSPSTVNQPSVVSSTSYNNTQPIQTNEPVNKKHAHIFIFIYVFLIILVAAVSGVYYWQHKKVTSLSAQVTSLNKQLSTYKNANYFTGLTQRPQGDINNVSVSARNSKRVSDIKSLQTHLEAFFSQNGYYPSLTDMNSTTWRNSNMKSLDTTALTEPSNSSTSSLLVTAPSTKAYAYAVADSKGASCESNDKNCAKYTLTATYEGSVNGSTTFAVNNLD